MIYRPNKPALALVLAALAVGLPVRAADEVSSGNHPVLKRAFAEHPTADADANGVLSLAEYDILQKKPLVQPPAEKDKPPVAPLLPLLPVLPNGEVVVSEFEEPNSHKAPGWTNEGAAFQGDLAAGTRMMRRRVGHFQGAVFLTTHGKSEAETGRLVSPPFPLELDFLAVTMSGGRLPQRVGVNVWIGDEVVRCATGNNDDNFETVALDVREFRGRMARVELIDQHRGIWGHLNVDRIVLTAKPSEGRRIDSRPPPPAPLPGLALTTTGFRTGTLAVADGKLTSGQKPLATETVLLAINAQEAPEEPAPNTRPPSAVQLISGEIWQAQIMGLEGKTLAINSPLIGQRKLPLEGIASIEFQYTDAPAAREPGHLYRTGAEPIPGTLVWIRDKDIAVDCPLGVIPVDRPVVERYVIAKPKPADPASADVVGIVGGGLLRGKTSFVGNQIVVTHSVLGELKLDWKTVAYLRRNAPGLDWMEDLAMTTDERDALTLPPPAPQWIDGDGETHLRALRILPDTVARFALKTNAAGKGRLQAEIAAVRGCRTAMKVTVLAGDTAIWNQTIAAGSAPVPLSLDFPAAKQLAIKIEFAGPLSFPCGIELRDPLVLNLAQLTTQPQTTQPN
ncbi:MAG: hypothetical protein DVB27_06725 [Verrucomicrobia bacterium]|nr:MAG: hypothetical protein DVB27_06725 [Verrucomicrobiota bacterium]